MLLRIDPWSSCSNPCPSPAWTRPSAPRAKKAHLCFAVQETKFPALCVWFWFRWFAALSACWWCRCGVSWLSIGSFWVSFSVRLRASDSSSSSFCRFPFPSALWPFGRSCLSLPSSMCRWGCSFECSWSWSASGSPTEFVDSPVSLFSVAGVVGLSSLCSSFAFISPGMRTLWFLKNGLIFFLAEDLNEIISIFLRAVCLTSFWWSTAGLLSPSTDSSPPPSTMETVIRGFYRPVPPMLFARPSYLDDYYINFIEAMLKELTTLLKKPLGVHMNSYSDYIHK